jgi:hypothetical protein
MPQAGNGPAPQTPDLPQTVPKAKNRDQSLTNPPQRLKEMASDDRVIRTIITTAQEMPAEYGGFKAALSLKTAEEWAVPGELIGDRDSITWLIQAANFSPSALPTNATVTTKDLIITRLQEALALTELRALEADKAANAKHDPPPQEDPPANNNTEADSPPDENFRSPRQSESMEVSGSGTTTDGATLSEDSAAIAPDVAVLSAVGSLR